MTVLAVLLLVLLVPTVGYAWRQTSHVEALTADLHTADALLLAETVTQSTERIVAAVDALTYMTSMTADRYADIHTLVAATVDQLHARMTDIDTDMAHLSTRVAVGHPRTLHL